MKKKHTAQHTWFSSGLFGNWKLGIGNSTKGFSLVEMLFYIAILSIALLAVTETLLAVTRSYGTLRSAQRIEQDAASSLDRMTREIRDASAITDSGSTFDANPGELLLSTTDASSTPRTVDFYLSNGQLMLKENGSVSGGLTGVKTTVANLVFRKITTARSKGVKIELTLTSGTGMNAKTESFYSTAVLRDSY